ncbi:histidine-containing phosphotransfer protein 4-like [Silene latifolia]|uniref:histidine-containing phosphotransfer protein 4-like n=1 Tax=Silene latifolia TaxID=37657 RepID=UPI003D76D6FD
MERNQLHRQVTQMRQSFFDQGFLDDQFVQLEELQDDTNPNFVEEVVTLFYRDSGRLLANIEQAMNRCPLDFIKLENHMQQFRGSCSSIGAKRVRSECNQFKEYCRAGNTDSCKRTFQQIKREYTTLKRKLESYFQLVRQVGPREMATRPR